MFLIVLAFHIILHLHSNLHKLGVALHNFKCGAKLKTNCSNLQLLWPNCKKLKAKELIVQIYEIMFGNRSVRGSTVRIDLRFGSPTVGEEDRSQRKA